MGLLSWLLDTASDSPVREFDEQDTPAVQTEAHAVTFNGPAGAERAITRLMRLYSMKHPADDTPAEIKRYQHKVGSLGFEVPTNAAECVALLDSLKG